MLVVDWIVCTQLLNEVKVFTACRKYIAPIAFLLVELRLNQLHLLQHELEPSHRVNFSGYKAIQAVPSANGKRCLNMGQINGLNCNNAFLCNVVLSITTKLAKTWGE